MAATRINEPIQQMTLGNMRANGAVARRDVLATITDVGRQALAGT
jgi:hypothetical protein